jgi:hypothetical protein
VLTADAVGIPEGTYSRMIRGTWEFVRERQGTSLHWWLWEKREGFQALGIFKVRHLSKQWHILALASYSQAEGSGLTIFPTRSREFFEGKTGYEKESRQIMKPPRPSGNNDPYLPTGSFILQPL